jgi:transcriptional regulator with XRE-family HTH domain
MPKRAQSLYRNKRTGKSRLSDIASAISDALREARLRKQLSQQELAGKLGLRQRQISDLERAAIDPRLSTIQNVARALDLELMLLPRHLISAVEALERAGSGTDKRPLYALDEDETAATPDEPPHLEVGDTRNLTSSNEQLHHRPKRPQR